MLAAHASVRIPEADDRDSIQVQGKPVALIKDDAAIEGVTSHPVEDLLEPGAPSAARTDKRAVGQEEDALLEVLRQATDLGSAVEGGAVVYNWDVHAQVPQVSSGVCM